MSFSGKKEKAPEARQVEHYNNLRRFGGSQVGGAYPCLVKFNERSPPGQVS